MMDELAKANRSYRRFDETRPVGMKQLESWVANARYAASAMNAQPLRYMLCTEENTNAAVFPLTKWAGYLTDWDGPAPGERPTAYVVVLHDTEVKVKPEFVWCDVGLTSQNILLSAREEGFAGCMIASVAWDRLRETLAIDGRYEPLIVIALGAPAEEVHLVDVGADGSIKYYHDEAGAHYVPKRAMDDLVIGRRG